MKKSFTVFTAVVLVFIFTVFTTAASSYKLGDVNKDGIISITDATEIQRHLTDLTTLDNESKKLANVDNDDDISIMDATCVQMYLVRLIDDFPGNAVPPTAPPTDSDGYYDQVVKP